MLSIIPSFHKNLLKVIRKELRIEVHIERRQDLNSRYIPVNASFKNAVQLKNS
jgi:hypothetical protein